MAVSPLSTPPTPPTPLQQMARTVASSLRGAECDRDARQVVDIYLPRLDALATSDEKLLTRLATRVARDLQAEQDERHREGATRAFFQLVVDALGNGLSGPIGPVIANLGARLGNSPVGHRINVDCLEAIAESGTDAEKLLATTVHKAAAPLSDADSNRVIRHELALLADPDRPPMGMWMKQAASTAMESLRGNCGGNVDGAIDMGAVLLQAVADAGTPAEKIFAESTRLASLSDGSVGVQQRAVTTLMAGVQAAYPALLSFAPYAEGNSPRQALLQGAQQSAPSPTTATLAEVGRKACQALDNQLGRELALLVVETLKKTPEGTEQAVPHLGLASMDMIDDRSGNTEDRYVNMRTIGRVFLHWVQGNSTLPENRRIAAEALENTAPRSLLSRLFHSSLNKTEALACKKALDQIEINARASTLGE